MKIYGLQKLSLLDYPDKMAATVFTGGCNFRCPFCHNGLLVTQLEKCAPMPEEQVTDYLKLRTGLLEGVCVSGGEPLLNEDIGDFLRRLKDMGFSVKLDTNGSFPERLRRLIEDGLVDYVAMDIKNRIEKYPETAGVPDMDVSGVMESAALLRRGLVEYEFRTTVVRELHTEDDLMKIGEWLSDSPRYFLQPYVDSGGTIAPGLSGWEPDELERVRGLISPHFGVVAIRG